MTSQSRYDAFLPGYELSWSATHYDYDDAARYTGAYYDGTAYSNILAAVGKRILCFKQALVATGWTVEQSSTTTHVLAGDLWTNAPDIERGTGHWIVLRGPDGVSQLVIQKDYLVNVRCFYFYWSPGGLFTTGTLPATRPTATDEIGPGSESTTTGYIAKYDSTPATGAFYGFRGLRGAEITSRVLQIDATGGTGKIEFMFCLEWFVTDLPAGVYPRNVCTFAFTTGITKVFFDKDTATRYLSYCRVTMPDGKRALPVAMFCPFSYPGHWPSEFVGALDSKSRMLPMYLQEYTTSGDHQFFGYLPDLYFGNNSDTLASWYGYRTFGGTWSRYAELCLPYFATDYATSLGDSNAVSLVIATASESVVDDTPATFGGVVNATTIDNSRIRLTWVAGSDDVSIAAALVYEIHYATTQSAPFIVRGEAVGTITHDVTFLKAGTTYYFRVRCRDEAGNVDINTAEVSATTTGTPDATPPTFTLESPAAGSPIRRTTTLVGRLEDLADIRRAWVVVEYPDLPGTPREIVHDGDAFDSLFAASTRTVIANGYRFYVRRVGGWPSRPRVTWRAIDTSGNEIE